MKINIKNPTISFKNFNDMAKVFLKIDAIHISPKHFFVDPEPEFTPKAIMVSEKSIRPLDHIIEIAAPELPQFYLIRRYTHITSQVVTGTELVRRYLILTGKLPKQPDLSCYKILAGADIHQIRHAYLNHYYTLLQLPEILVISLNSSNITNLAELAEKSDSELLALPGLGKRSLKKLRQLQAEASRGLNFS